MKWISLILGIGIFRGIVFPDYRFEPNIVIISFGMPLLTAGLAAYLSATKRLSWLQSSTLGLLSVYLSTLIGILVYGLSVGSQYVTNDTESQAVFMATFGIQTAAYLIGLGIFFLLSKRYIKTISRDAP